MFLIFSLLEKGSTLKSSSADEEWKVLVLSLIVALKDLDDPQQNHVPISRYIHFLYSLLEAH